MEQQTYWDGFYGRFYTINWDGSKNWLPNASEMPVRQQSSATANTNVTVNIPRRVNHGLHLVLTIMTCGLWAPVWLIIAIASK